MRFGGHETFAIREGWLHKGLKMVVEEPDCLVDEYAADWLGVGINMAKSIRHWLQATGLAVPAPEKRAGKTVLLQETELGRLVYERDPYFIESGTWWALHVNLANAPEHAASWVWFFNHFNLNRFERSVCVESVCRYLEMSKGRMPRIKTLQRDIACLLNTYARVIPAEHDDPEEARDCPFTELGLLSYFRTSGYYQLHQGPKDVPPHVFGYALSKAFPEASEGKGIIDITIREVTRQAGGPCRAFVLTAESMFEMALKAEGNTPRGDFEITGLATDRVIRVRKKKPLDWLRDYYLYVEQADRHAA
jgi:Protein of unknown function (DUF4007)